MKNTAPAELIHQGKLISIYREPVALREGGITFFDIVKHPGGSVIAALDNDNQICLLRQWRHAVNKTVWEAPAGCVDKGEAPLTTAQRELEEEAGICAKNWVSLGQTIPSPGFSNEVLHLYKATELFAGTLNLDAAEQLQAHWVPLEEAFKMARQGEIDDAKTLALLMRLS